MRLCRALQVLADWTQPGDPLEGVAGAPPASFIGEFVGGYFVDIAPSSDWLLAQDEGAHATAVHPAALEACAAVERIVAGLLPSFISDGYSLRIELLQPTDIAVGRIVTLQLDPDDDYWLEDLDSWLDPFGLDAAPGGFQVWLQLALLEAVGRVNAVCYLIEEAIREIGALIGEADDEREMGWDDLDLEPNTERPTILSLGPQPTLRPEDVEPHKVVLEEALAYLREPTLMAPAIAFKHRSRERVLAFDDDQPGGLFEPPRERVYLLDEPEQRLHPALARRAAEWLGALPGQWGTQCVIATHSLAFIDIPADSSVYELYRSADQPFQALIQPLDPASLSPYTELAKAIGFDRGELLARWRAFLLAPPRVTVVLEELCGELLDRSWIRLIPVNNTTRPLALKEIELLAQITSAPIAIVVASVPEGDIDRLRAANASDRAKAAADPGELGVIAAALRFAAEQEHVLELLTLDVPDVIDLLEPEVIRANLQEPGADPFPGPNDAEDQYRAARQHEPHLSYLTFLQTRYGISPDLETLRQAARKTRQAGREPPSRLTDLIWHLARLDLQDPNAPR